MRLTPKRIRVATILIIVGGALVVYLFSSTPIPDPENGLETESFVEPGPPASLPPSRSSDRRATDVEHTDRLPKRQDVLLTIGAGEHLGIRWTNKPVPSYAIEGDLGVEYESLRTLAENGDVEAAYQLWVILDSCKFAYESRDDLDNAINVLTETQSIKLPSMDESKYVSDESSRSWREVLDLSFEYCDGITDELKAEKNSWLKQASDAGYPPAMIRYSKIEQDPVAALDLANKRWQAGDVDAMRELYEFYQQDYLSGKAPGNKVVAYANLFVYKIISEKKWGPGSRRMERFLPEFEDATRLMRPNELAEAEAVARRLIETNPNCCFRH